MVVDIAEIERRYNEVWDKIDRRLTLNTDFSRVFNMFRFGNPSGEVQGHYIAHTAQVPSDEAMVLGGIYGLRPRSWINGQILIDIRGLEPLIGKELVGELVEIKEIETSAKRKRWDGLRFDSLMKRDIYQFKLPNSS